MVPRSGRQVHSSAERYFSVRVISSQTRVSAAASFWRVGGREVGALELPAQRRRHHRLLPRPHHGAVVMLRGEIALRLITGEGGVGHQQPHVGAEAVRKRRQQRVGNLAQRRFGRIAEHHQKALVRVHHRHHLTFFVERNAVEHHRAGGRWRHQQRLPAHVALGPLVGGGGRHFEAKQSRRLTLPRLRGLQQVGRATVVARL